jgi:hypothetical protein
MSYTIRLFTVPFLKNTLSNTYMFLGKLVYFMCVTAQFDSSGAASYWHLDGQFEIRPGHFLC